MIPYWALWGLGWLCMPRMTIGIMISVLSDYNGLGVTLAIIGGLIDIANN